jgi:hypothetical protein
MKLFKGKEEKFQSKEEKLHESIVAGNLPGVIMYL